MQIVAIVAALTGFVVTYVVWVRPYLKSLPQFSEIYQAENGLWATIGTWLDGRRTILIGIWGEFVAFMPDALQVISGADLKTALNLPNNWAALVNIIVPLLMIIFRAKAR